MNGVETYHAVLKTYMYLRHMSTTNSLQLSDDITETCVVCFTCCHSVLNFDPAEMH